MPRCVRDPRMVCVCVVLVSDRTNRHGHHHTPRRGAVTYLAGTSDPQGGQQGIATFAPMGRQDTLYQGRYAGALEDVKLGGVFFEHLGEGELFCGALPVVGGIQYDMRRRPSLLGLDGQKALGICRSSRWWAKAKVDLKQVGRLGRRR